MKFEFASQHLQKPVAIVFCASLHWQQRVCDIMHTHEVVDVVTRQLFYCIMCMCICWNQFIAIVPFHVSKRRLVVTELV